jgi:uncharacterized protein
MDLLEALAVLVAGALAGGMNAIVGSGSLVTFPTLVAVGFPPVVANVSNTVGLVPGGVSAMVGYRRELRGQARRCLVLGCGTTAGALIGGLLLLALPSEVFDAVVPALILLAVVLMALRPSPAPGDVPRASMPAGIASAFGTGIYGGYFGAAQGIILLALLRLSFEDDLQRLNGLKNVLVGLANAVAAVLFIAVAEVAWDAALLIAAGSVVGAQAGARYGRRLPQEWLRRAVIVYGAAVAVVLAVT